MKIKEGDWIYREGYRKKILSDEKNLGKGNLVQIVEIKPGWKVKPHYHQIQTEFFYILHGEATLSIGGEEYIAKPGECYLCKPGKIHFVENHGEDDFMLLVFKTNWREKDSYWEVDL
jgi:quercetin dioxygenase-like cupin family protein